MLVGQNGILSTPAASAVIRSRKTDGGLILSASHNPAGADGDFGLKYNISNGGPAPEAITDAIFEQTKAISSYKTLDTADIDLGQIGTVALGDMAVEIVDPVEDYAALMEELFDFDALRALFASGFTMKFDAMHAVTGPYATTILEDTLGAPAGTVMNGVPSVDTSPHELAPTSQQQLMWPSWGQYHETSGMAGEPPDMPAAKRLIELAKMAVSGEIDAAWFEDPTTSDDEVHAALLTLPGIGPYAAGNMMQLLGRYGFLAVDTETIRHGRESLGFEGSDRAVEKQVRAHYDAFGAHKFRSYWFELWTEHEQAQGPAWTWPDKSRV